jgi:general secretion pathway protein E
MTQPESLSDRILRHLPEARQCADGGDVWARIARLAGCEPVEAMRECGAHLEFAVLDQSEVQALVVSADDAAIDACRRGVLVGTDRHGGRIAVLADPWDEVALAVARKSSGRDGRVMLARASAIDARLGADRNSAPASMVQQGSSREPSIDAQSLHAIDLLAPSIQRNSVMRFVDSVIHDAWAAGASDIHVETRASGLHVRRRVDGVLEHHAEIGGIEMARQVVSRIKVLAELDISEQRIPQDGRVRLKLEEAIVDFRVSVMPSAHGEDVVLRILDKRHLTRGASALSIESLGFDSVRATELRELAERSHGLLLVTGPTGSGKTTTLYSLLSELSSGHEKIVTIEDPIEYEIAGVLQIPVNEKKGLTFSKGLRSVLRHDPDLIMVGEIRDRETADIAVQAALTGHQVFATVHANSVYDVIGRFVHMQVDLYSFMSSLNGVLSQRLLRRLCPSCKVPVAPSMEEGRRIARSRLELKSTPIFKALGCPHCRNTGYLGRTVICELVTIDDAFRDLVVRRASLTEAKAHLQAAGVKSLAKTGLELVSSGETSFSEYWRAVATG